MFSGSTFVALWGGNDPLRGLPGGHFLQLRGLATGLQDTGNSSKSAADLYTEFNLRPEAGLDSA